MGITNTFDNDSKEIIRPQDAIMAINGFPEVVISVFSKNLMIYCLIQLK